jgi:hypothetical protein
MSRYSDSDPYLDPATGVLRNRLGITDEAALEAAEANMVATRSYELAQTPIPGRFDLPSGDSSLPVQPRLRMGGRPAHGGYQQEREQVRAPRPS